MIISVLVFDTLKKNQLHVSTKKKTNLNMPVYMSEIIS